MTGTGQDDARRRAEELLVLHVSGRLSAAERAELDALMADDPTLADEETFLRTVKSEIAAREVDHSPGEFGLARLNRAIEAEAREAAPAAPRETSATVVPIRPVAAVWRYAAIAATLLFAVLATGIVTNPEGVVRLAGGTVERVTGPVLVVAFRPEATEAEIRRLLLALDLAIVDGPSALGLYRIAAADEPGAARALTALAAAAAVESAERE